MGCGPNVDQARPRGQVPGPIWSRTGGLEGRWESSLTTRNEATPRLQRSFAECDSPRVRGALAVLAARGACHEARLVAVRTCRAPRHWLAVPAASAASPPPTSTWHRLNPDQNNPAPEHERLRCTVTYKPLQAGHSDTAHWDLTPRPAVMWNAIRWASRMTPEIGFGSSDLDSKDFA
jgi:hypothetical protein